MQELLVFLGKYYDSINYFQQLENSSAVLYQFLKSILIKSVI